mmetsp:Transcript_25964/g.52379  ORF Transcript_25964/g.52379 Transcript_25964/m.52379 type:complete len:216 (+) Transcript_25964:116-763(+)
MGFSTSSMPPSCGSDMPRSWTRRPKRSCTGCRPGGRGPPWVKTSPRHPVPAGATTPLVSMYTYSSQTTFFFQGSSFPVAHQFLMKRWTSSASAPRRKPSMRPQPRAFRLSANSSRCKASTSATSVHAGATWSEVHTRTCQAGCSSSSTSRLTTEASSSPSIWKGAGNRNSILSGPSPPSRRCRKSAECAAVRRSSTVGAPSDSDAWSQSPPSRQA